nr:flagellar hook-associated protein FlgL [uncultured Friedmanniella sp.]
MTQRMMISSSLAGLNGNLAAVNRMQEQLTSGKVLSRPSDSPTDTNTAMQTRSRQAAVSQQAENINDARSWMDQTDTTLQNMIGVTHRIRNLTVQGLNSGATSASSASAIATEVALLRDSLLGMANTTVQGRPIFGGVTTGSTAYDATTGAYTGVLAPDGSPVPVTRRLSDVESIRIDVTGPEAFGTGPGELFAVVADIADHVLNDPAALAGDLTALDASLNRMLVAIAGVGASAARVETARTVNMDSQLSLTSRLSAIEDVDLAKTTMELQMQQVTYQAALSVTAKTLQQSLVDFLR